MVIGVDQHLIPSVPPCLRMLRVQRRRPGGFTTENSETGSAGHGRRLEIFASHIHRPFAPMFCGRIASDRSEGNFFKLPSVSREAGFRVIRGKSRGDCPQRLRRRDCPQRILPLMCKCVSVQTVNVRWRVASTSTLHDPNRTTCPP